MCLAGKAVKNTSAWQVKCPAKLFFRLIKAFFFLLHKVLFFFFLKRLQKNKTKQKNPTKSDILAPTNL